jgi:hypothetical protein
MAGLHRRRCPRLPRTLLEDSRVAAGPNKASPGTGGEPPPPPCARCSRRCTTMARLGGRAAVGRRWGGPGEGEQRSSTLARRERELLSGGVALDNGSACGMGARRSSGPLRLHFLVACARNDVTEDAVLALRPHRPVVLRACTRDRVPVAHDDAWCGWARG